MDITGIILLLIAVSGTIISKAAAHQSKKYRVDENISIVPARVNQISSSHTPITIHRGDDSFISSDVLSELALPRVETIITSARDKNQSVTIQKQTDAEFLNTIPKTSAKPGEKAMHFSALLLPRSTILDNEDLAPVDVFGDELSTSEQIEIVSKFQLPMVLTLNENLILVPSLPLVINNEPDMIIEEIAETPEMPFEIVSDLSITDSTETGVEEDIILAPLPQPTPVIDGCEYLNQNSELPIQEQIEVIVDDNIIVSQPALPISIIDEPSQIIEELIAMPEAPILPPLQFNFTLPIFTEEIETEDPVQPIIPCEANGIEESIETIPPTLFIPEAPLIQPSQPILGDEEPIIIEPAEILPELIVPDPVEIIVEENIPPLSLPIIEEVVPEWTIIPEAPTLPAISLNMIPPIITEPIEIEEPLETMAPFPIEIAERPIFLEQSLRTLPPRIDINMEQVPQSVVIPNLRNNFVKPIVFGEQINAMEQIINPKLREHKKLLLKSFNRTPISTHYVQREPIMEAKKKPFLLRRTMANIPVSHSSIPLSNVQFGQESELRKNSKAANFISYVPNIVKERIRPNVMIKESPILLRLLSGQSSMKVPVK